MSTIQDFALLGKGDVGYVLNMTKVEFSARYAQRWLAGHRKSAYIVVDASGTPCGWGASHEAAVYHAELAGVAVQRPN